MRARLALGYSGGGDSTALLLALRAAFPDVELHALIVDHALRPESAEEAYRAARFAKQAGAYPQRLTWHAPRAGQGHARQARHQFLAQAARRAGAQILCLGHTWDDRVETLRMRAARPGGEARMAGPSALDPSPVWPEGEDLVLARPFLGLRRAELRSYLTQVRACWIEDPSNADHAYERVRVRNTPLRPDEEAKLIARSDAAQAGRAALNRAAGELIAQACVMTPWGGARLEPTRFAEADRDTALKALETVILGVSGRAAPPLPAALERLLVALVQGEAASCGGAHLTARAILGRDAGAAGRADGAPGAAELALGAGESGVFDGRWRVCADRPVQVRAHGTRLVSMVAGVPVALRPALAAVHAAESGARLALPGLDPGPGVESELLQATRMSSRLLPPKPPTWFDVSKAATLVRAALAKPGQRANISRDADVMAATQIANGVSRSEEKN